jgi:membrane-associated protease RseP (regulator of RpoE activity)
MTYLLGMVAFVLALLVSVVLHEAGHFVTAKRSGMKATQFFVGFGTTVWSRRRGETEYGFKAIPAGGFVKIVGYTPLEEIDPADEPRAFYRRPAGQRAVVIIAGVVVNFVIAFVLLAGLAMSFGEPVAGTPSNTIATVSSCVPASLTSTGCRHGSTSSPAGKAGLRPGDTIVSFAGRPISGWADLRDAIAAAKPGAAVPVTVERNGQPVITTVTPADSDGQSFLGVSAKVVGAGYRRRDPIGASGYAVSTIGSTVKSVGSALAQLPGALPKLFSPQRSSSQAGQVGSVVGATEVSGQIFAAHATWKDKAVAYLELVASVNIFLGALNVVPLLPLDGGHLSIVIYERLRAWTNRVRGRPDPGTVDLTRLLPLTYLVVMVLIGLGLVLIMADLLNPLTVPQ